MSCFIGMLPIIIVAHVTNLMRAQHLEGAFFVVDDVVYDVNNRYVNWRHVVTVISSGVFVSSRTRFMIVTHIYHSNIIYHLICGQKLPLDVLSFTVCSL